jgi:hypothetical protein
MRLRLLLPVAFLAANAQAQTAWKLELAHAIRPPEGSPGMIGNVVRVAVTDDGVVYVAEQTPARVTRYDAQGNFVRVVVREGSGPKEAQRPGIALQGDTLVVYDPMTMRLSRIGPDNKLMSERPVDVNAIGFPIWTTARGDIILDDPGSGPGYNDGALRLAPSGKVDTVRWFRSNEDDRFMQWKSPSWVIKGAPFSPYGVSAFDPAGRLVIGGTRRSRWFVLSGRDTIQTVTLPDHEVAIPTAIRDSVWRAWRARIPATLTNVDNVVKKDLIPTTFPPWVTFDISPRGEWWIGRPAINGALGAWDIVENGRIVGHVAVPPRTMDIRGGSGRAIGRNFVALVHEDENDVPWIGVYRIVRPPR